MRTSLWALFFLSSMAGCGPDARRVAAEEALETTRAVVTELDATTGGEAPEDVRRTFADVSTRLVQTEHAFDLWSGVTGSLAFERMAACLSTALGDLRQALMAHGRSVPLDLESAEAAMASFTDQPCRRRRE